MLEGLGLGRRLIAPMRALILTLVIATTAIASADSTALLRGLDADDPTALSAAITTIERTPTTPDLADVLFSAGRACEDRLHDPVRALALYERILAELPDAGVAIAAGRRAEKLRQLKSYPKQAAELASLVADADRLAPDDVIRRADLLAATSWPGAADAALWLADWACRTRRFAVGQAHFAQLKTRWPGSEQAQLGARNAAGCALDARNWNLAEQLANELPAGDVLDRAAREDVLAGAAKGRARDRLYTASWIGLALALVLLVASLVEAMLRGGARKPGLRPPIEVLFLAPVAAVLITGTMATAATIAPSVTRISVGGLALAWISGTALDLLRSRDRAVRLRAIGHVIACAVGVLAIGYISMTYDGLLDMLSETVRFGPGD